MQTLDAGLMAAQHTRPCYHRQMGKHSASVQTLTTLKFCSLFHVSPRVQCVQCVQVHCRRNGSHHKLGSASIINFPRVPASTSTTSNYYTRGSAQLCCPLSSVNNRMLLLDKILRSRARLRRSDTYHCVNCWLLEFLHYLAVGICWYLRCHLGEN